ncbi:hypothetical protein ACVGXF_06070, partial [Enterobacter hormaechei]
FFYFFGEPLFFLFGGVVGLFFFFYYYFFIFFFFCEGGCNKTDTFVGFLNMGVGFLTAHGCGYGPAPRPHPPGGAVKNAPAAGPEAGVGTGLGWGDKPL